MPDYVFFFMPLILKGFQVKNSERNLRWKWNLFSQIKDKYIPIGDVSSEELFNEITIFFIRLPPR